MSQVITDAFSSYWQQCLVEQTPVVLDEFVLAHIPGLDPDAPIDPASGLPPTEQIVHRHTVDQRGRINNDAVAYSIVMDTTVGDFTFNAMYLINTGLNLVGMIVHKGEETKLKTDPASGQTGNSLVKSMLMEYDRAAEASQTVIDASTWQIDYAARLRGMDEDMRRQAMGTFGHAAFYGDGFKLVNDAGRYKVQSGQGYVGGLLVELTAEQEVTPSAKPMGLWLDVYRAGSLLSPWVNHVTLTLSTTDLVDYVDTSGYPHFVTRLATINSDDSVTDTRAKRTLTLTGDVTGQASFNGPDSIELEVTIEDNSHGHTIDNVEGLQEALDGKAEAEHDHEIPDIAGLSDELDSKYPKAGGPIGDFWRGDTAKRYGAVLVLGMAADAKASLVILAKKYVGTALAKTGFIGRILYDRGLTTSALQSDFVDLTVSSAYQQNSASMLFRSGGSVAAAKIVEVTYNGETHYALYRPMMSSAAVVAVGHAFTADLPVLVPDATAYEVTDVATTERIYHWGNMPTAADVEAVSKTGDTMTGKLTLAPDSNNPLTLDVPAGQGAFILSKEAGVNKWYVGIGSNGSSDVLLSSYTHSNSIALKSDHIALGKDPRTNAVQGTQPTSLTRKDWVEAQVGTRAPMTHTHTAAQGNADIVASGYGQTGTYGLFYIYSESNRTVGSTAAGGSLNWANVSGDYEQTAAGTWKLVGFVKSNDSHSETSLWIRIDQAVLMDNDLSGLHWLDAEHTAIDMIVRLDNGEELPFTASRFDVEAHGRWLFAMARDGEFGPVAEYVPPTPLEVATRKNPQTRKDAMALATTNAQHFEMMGNTEQAAAWRTYYRDLYALASTPEWPLVEQWPVSPELAV